MNRSLFAKIVFVVATISPLSAQTLTVAGGERDQTNVVVMAAVPPGTPEGVNVAELANGRFVPAQLTPAPLIGGPEAKQVVTFVLPKLLANDSVRVRLGTNAYIKAPPQFQFVEKPGEQIDLLYNGKPVMRYINAPHDSSSKDRHDVTFKVFHHVFDPATGEIELTSGAYPFSAKDKKFPHHRGLFYGWMKIGYGDGQKADVWHGRAGEFTQHEKVIAEEAGEVLGRQRLAISWHGAKGDTFATEEREVTAYHVPGGTMIDWASALRTELPKVVLDGDPQHAGFHFRAAQEVATKTAKQTYYLRPDGKDQPGKTRNWPGNKDHVDLPWNAMSYVIGGKRYTTLYLAHPDNPGEARHSERDYGRFGSYFVHELTPAAPLRVRYRLWIQEGEMTAEQCQAMYDAFVHQPMVTAGK